MKKKNVIKYFSVFMLLNIIFETVSPTVALALTNGPMQAEFLGFEPASSSEMVDLFTGDFKYNIPLMDVDGYPLNLSYKAGANMETEASWVGLGWSLNPGVLNRMMKGLPDDFNGEEVQSELKIKPFNTSGAGIHTSTRFGGGFSFGVYYVTVIGGSKQYGTSDSYMLLYNNHKGFGFEQSHDSQQSWSFGNTIFTTSGSSGSGVILNSFDGGITTNNSSEGNGFGADKLTNTNGKGTNYNTRNGAITNSTYHSNSVRPTLMYTKSVSFGSSLPAGSISYAPKIPFDQTGGGGSNSLKAGLWTRFCGFEAGAFMGVKGFYSSISPINTVKAIKSYGYLYAQNADNSSLRDFNRIHDDAIREEAKYTSFSHATYDLFFASAQGMSSSFRPFRSDINLVSDPVQSSNMESKHSGYELGLPGILHYLKESSQTSVLGYSRPWTTSFFQSLSSPGYTDVAVPTLSTSINFSVNASKALIERTYFKEMGELTERDQDYEESVKTDELIVPELVEVGATHMALSPIQGGGRKKRDKRAKNIRCLTAEQASQYGFEPMINFYDRNSFSVNSNKLVTPSANSSTMRNLDRKVKNNTAVGTFSVADHISEVSVTNPNGGIYIYGIPSYNLSKKTVAFNASVRTESIYVNNNTPYKFSDVHSYSWSNPLNVSEPCQFVQYGADEIGNNNRGLDNFIKKEQTPAYASSYLLTNILSSDYVDVTGDGPSYDDLGTFTRFNYSKGNDYRWRDPFCVDAAITPSLAGGISTATCQAKYDKGLICDELDDKGQYEYGIRENYYLHSIETKNYVAVFRTSERADALGVQNEMGTKSGTKEALQLDAIELYSKNEILQKGGISNAIPVKSVHFEYDYSLCSNTFNTLLSANPSGGKLTLKKVYFTYGNSKKSALSPYEFTYAINPSYNPGSVDRWGVYKPNLSPTAVGATTGLNNAEFPYAEQNKQLADQYAAAWNMNEIKTPSGATIKITYEADDYGYVQNQPAAQMCKIYNCVPNIGSTGVDVVSTHATPLTCNIKDNPKLIIDLSSMNAGIPTSLSLSDANAYAKKHLFSGAQDNAPGTPNFPAPPLTFKPLYFKCFLKVAGPECGAGINKEYFEFINGYADIEDAGLFTAGIANNTYTAMNSAGTGTVSCYRFAYLTLKGEVDTKAGSNQKQVGPVCFAGWDFLRNYAPRIAYPGSEPENMGGDISLPKRQLQTLKDVVGVAKVDLENGKLGNANKRFYDQDFCTTLYPAKSFVRVYSANYKKLGGGHRVKKIVTNDNWAGMTSSINGTAYNESSTEYGQEFEYITVHSRTGDVISSGVASYEPLIGGDENSMRQPIPYSVEKEFAPNDHFFMDAPLGEMLYPTALVGYSKIRIRNIADQAVTNVAGIGKTEFEFFTAKDFPFTDETKPVSKGTSEEIPEEATLSKFIDRYDNPEYDAMKVLHHTQGNILKFNDMHGKLRSIAVFGEDNSTVPIAKTEYFYKNHSGENFKCISTWASTIDDQNVISTKVIARDIEVTADTRENLTTTSISGDNKLFGWGIAVYPIPVTPFVWISPDLPSIAKDKFKGSAEIGYRSATLTKIVQEYGILEKVVNIYNGMTSTTENLLWDANTGNVVLTKVTNEHDQPVYNFNYPAYWAYKEMGPKFKRDGIGLYCPPVGTTSLNVPFNVSTGVFTHTLVNDPVIFEPGDEVIITDVSNPASPAKIGDRFWFVHNPAASNYLLMDRYGKLMTTTNYTAALASKPYVIRLVKPVNGNNLDASMGYVNSLTNPQNSVTSAIDFSVTGQKILDAGAQEFCSGGAAFTDPAISQQTGINVPLGAYTTPNINPVISEAFGKMRPTNAYKFKTTRSYASQPNNKTDGIYSSAATNSFTPFWAKKADESSWAAWRGNGIRKCDVFITAIDNGKWIPFTHSVYYSPYGYMLQSANSISVTSAQRYGFNHTLPVLEAQNARANEVGFESFEEYPHTYPYLAVNTSSVFPNDHLGFYSQISSTVGAQPNYTTSTAHTGKYSLSYGINQSVSLKHKTKELYGAPVVAYGNNNCGCRLLSEGINASRLDLDYGKTYIASMWVKGNTPATDYSGLVNFSVKQSYGVSSSTVLTTSMVKSAVINGWQKLDYEFTMSAAPGVATCISEIIISSGASGGFYMDDFRIQPFNSTMSCTVYDPYQLRVCAELDDRNYATIYEYDKEGMLVRKKKETQNAVYTVQESRSGKNKR